MSRREQLRSRGPYSASVPPDIAVLDVVLNNADRKGGHVLPGWSGAVHGVDHGLTFHEEPKLRTVLWGFGGSHLLAEEREVLAPPDLEDIFGLQGGNIFQGEQDIAQMAFMRPSPTLAQYATPLEGLYLCGAGTHPGGGVMAASGHNAAQRILKDRKRAGRRRKLRRSTV